MENRKRSRENVEPTNDPKHKTNPPPSKKRKIQTKTKKQTKDMNEWSMEELKKYLNKNAITFQMGKSKVYYYRLAMMHKIVQEGKGKKEPTPPTPENSSFNEVIDHNKHEKESPESQSPLPLFNAPRKETPPLPLNLSHKPLTSDTFSEESTTSGEEPHTQIQSQVFDEIKEEEEFSVEKNETPPVHTQTSEYITPYTFKSRSLLSENITPVRDININTININAMNTPNEITQVTEEMVCERQPIQAQTQGIMTEENDTNTRTKLGPFQDISLPFPSVQLPNISFSIPKVNINSMEYINNNSNGKCNPLLFVLMSGVLLIVFAMLIPYIITLFMSQPYCDSDSDTLGSYYMLESIIKCKPCPYGAKCMNGMVQCPEEYELSKYGNMCVNDNTNAPEIAYKINEILGIRKGEHNCGYNNDTNMYKLNTETLKTEIKSELYRENEWDMAMKEIIPNVYTDTIIYNETTRLYEALRPIPPSNYCKALILKKEYFDNKINYFGFVWAGIIFISAATIIFVALRSKGQEMDEKAIECANCVLNKLSQQPTIHFSIITVKHWIMKTKNISTKEWEKSLKYINKSRCVDMVPEDINGESRMCWRWKGIVPFVPLN